jgi:hypothetical protein
MSSNEDFDKAWTEFHIGEMVADYSCLRGRNVNERSSIDSFLQEWKRSLERDPVPLKDAFFVHLALIGIYPIGEIDEWKVIIGNMVRSIAKKLPKDIEDIS